MSQLVLQISERLALKSVQGADAEELFRVIDKNRAHLRQWLPWLDRTRAVGDLLQYLETCRAQMAADESLQCGVWWEGHIVGAIGFHRFDHANRHTSIGYWLSADLQGHGIMTSACRQMVDYAFRERGMNRVEIRCATGNRKSRAIPERLRFLHEGTLREAEWLYDHFVDLEVYAMLAQAWSNPR